MKDFNNETLSRYLDGELHYEEACEVACHLEDDKNSQKQVLELLKSHILLKTYGRKMVAGKIRPDLVKSLEKIHPAEKGTTKIFRRPFFQIAAAISLLFAGFLTGKMNMPLVSAPSLTALPYKAELTTAINTVLEHQKSGTIHKWASSTGSNSASITPVKTYRDNKGTYYRVFFIDLRQNRSKQQLAGLAFRKGKNKWQTKIMYVGDDKLTAQFL